MFRSPTHGRMRLADVPGRLLEYYEAGKDEDGEYSIVIGSDSQNFSYTKSVTVVAMIRKGHGGVFFYEISHLPLLRDVRSKLYTETQSSLEVAMVLIEMLEDDKRFAEMYSSCPISIHVDAGNSDKGKTAQLIPEIVGWVRSLGYDCQVKPDSFVASSIADKISK